MTKERGMSNLYENNFLDLYQKLVTEAVHEEQCCSHYESKEEDFSECQWEYENGLWC